MLSRKQREIQERHQLLLNLSRDLFTKQGYFNVTMDTIAKEAEYSKGTIYQHFNCKECVIAELYIRFLVLIDTLFQRVVERTDLTTKLRMTLIMEAFISVNELCPDDINIKDLAISQTFSSKVKSELIEHITSLELNNTVRVIEIVKEAMEQGELVPAGHACAEDIALGCWAMGQGTFSLFNSSCLPDMMREHSPAELVRMNTTFYLKGIGWEQTEFSAEQQQQLAEMKQVFTETINEYIKS